MKHFKFALILGLTFLLFATPLQAEDEALLTQVALLELPNLESSLGGNFRLPHRALDVWAEGDLAVVTAGPAVHLVDLSDMENPALLSTIEVNGLSWDAKLSGDFLYVGLQFSADGNLFDVYNISDPANPEYITSHFSETFAGTHNIFIADNVAFVASLSGFSNRQGPGAINQGTWMVDISDPANPQDIGVIMQDNGNPIPTVHDLTVIDNRVYLAGWTSGFWLVDFENLDNPSELSYTVVANQTYRKFLGAQTDQETAHTHNVWPSEDGNLVWTTDEIVGEGVRLFDVSDTEDIKPLGIFRLSTNAIPHNVMVDGDFAYVSHYRDGLYVLEFERLQGPVEVAHINIGPSSDCPDFPFCRTFGVFVHGNYVLVGDMTNGLAILEKGGILRSDVEAVEEEPEIEAEAETETEVETEAETESEEDDPESDE